MEKRLIEARRMTRNRKYTGNDLRRKQLIPFLPCLVCDTTRGLEVDHINGNPNNNDQSNLQNLCEYHHKEKTNYGQNEIIKLQLKIEREPGTKHQEYIKSLEYYIFLPPNRSKHDLPTEEQLIEDMCLVASKMAKLEAQKAQLN